MTEQREPDAPGGPPAERLREQLEREFGEVPPESPTEPDRPGTRARTDEEESGVPGGESSDPGHGESESGNEDEDEDEGGGDHP